MTEDDKPEAWLGTDFKPRPIFHLIMLSLLINSAISTRTHQKTSLTPSGKGALNPEQRNWTDLHNGTIFGEKKTGLEEILHWVFDNEVEKGAESCIKGRSIRFKLGERFAFRKRLQFALLPIMYKMGVMTTLLTGLTVLVLKGLTIGVILLIFAFGNYFTKLHKQSHQSAQPIHVHVHSPDGHSKVTSFPSSFGPWDRVADEVHPSAFLGEDDLESYRRQLIQNSAAMVKFNPVS